MTSARGDGPLPEGAGREALVSEVARALRAAVPLGETAVAAVSGGPDSTALAWLVRAARPDLDLVLGHVRHGLRDDAEDLRCARELADRVAAPLSVLEVEVRPEGAGPEAAARAARYDALAAVARDVGTEVVLVGHTADDQAETVLLNAVRGSGLRGLAGMSPSRPDRRGIRVVRPLLGVRRQDLRALLREEGLGWAEDPSNRDAGQRRARARHDALPVLATLHGQRADPVAALARLADHARRDDLALEVLAERELGRVGRRWGAVLALPRERLDAMPDGLALRILRVTVTALGLPRPPLRQLQRILALRPGQSAHVRGLLATSGGGWLAVAPEGLAPLTPRRVVLPGRTPLEELDLALWADGERDPVDPRVVASGPPGARLPLHARLPVPADAELVVRARRPGDRIRLRDAGRSVQDLLTDTGVPRLVRDLLPIVVDAGDQPVWIPGIAVARVPQSLAHVRAWVAPF